MIRRSRCGSVLLGGVLWVMAGLAWADVDPGLNFLGREVSTSTVQEVGYSFAGLLLLSSVLAFWTGMLHRQVANRTTDLHRANRALKLLGASNEILVHAESEQSLLQKVCEEIVTAGDYAMAWVGYPEAEGEHRVLPVAESGDRNQYLKKVTIRWSDDPLGQGPTGTALRSGKSQVNANFEENPAMTPWGSAAREQGYRSSIAVPLLDGSSAFGALMAYSRQPRAFGTDEITLLEELASDLSYGIKFLRTQHSHREAEKQLRLAASVYQASSEGMLVTDENNRVLAVNPAFTTIMGYEADELLGKPPSYLNSPRHSPEFYDTLWNTLIETGRWEGEVWDYRKDGKEIPLWISINRIPLNEIQRSTGATTQYVALFKDITEKKQFDERMWQQANFDSLTKLPNRALFNDRLEQEIRKAQRTGESVSLLYIDLDGFKEVNDSLGHHFGDMLLTETAHRLRQRVRKSDTVARLSGDEFAIILPNLKNTQMATDIAQSILETLARPYQLNDERAYISGSIGISSYPSDATDANGLLMNADRAMYLSKNEGRNRFCHFTPAMQQSAQERFSLARDLHEAVAKQQFLVYFQPVIDLASRRVTKAEALIRWNHPDREMISPAVFIPISEKSTLMDEIGDWVFRESMHYSKRWSALLGFPFKIGVNMSPIQFKNRGRHEQWIGHLKANGLSGENVIIELTEGVLLNDHEDVLEPLTQFREAGIEIAIDDFGTGYSSLSYLNKFPVDYLKIDQSFTRNLEPGSSEFALSKAIIVMAHELGIKVTAEGIETENQRDMLYRSGCDFGQGYLFSRPIPPDAFERYLIETNQLNQTDG